MNCAQARPHLEVHADGELQADLRPALEAHLRSCERCRGMVERWRALRRCAGRVLSGTGIPAGLDSRIAATIAGQRGLAGRRMWLRNGAFAAAAVLLISVGVWRFGGFGISGKPGGGGSTPVLASIPAVPPEKLAFIYNWCNVGHPEIHDQFNVHSVASDTAREKLAEVVACNILLPDLRAQGYKLDGACRCFPVDAHVLHAYFKSPDSKPISVFSIEGRVTLASGRQAFGAEPAHRQYEEASANSVNIVKWDTCSASYAICSTLDMEQLVKLADSDSFRVAAISWGEALAQLPSR